MAISLRVTPEKLEQKASEFSDIIKDIQTHFDNIERAFARTKGYWRGDAGNKNRDGYASFKDDISYMLRRLREHPDDLLKMAGVYRKAETSAEKLGSQLKTDQIV